MGIEVRKGQGDVKLTREQFERRLRERFYDPEFQNVERQIGEVIDVAWEAYDQYGRNVEEGEDAGARRVGVSAASCRARFLRRRAWRYRGSRDAAAITHGLAQRYKAAADHAAGRHRSLHRILRTVRDEP